ncbi:MAG TPA: hypothetical protein VMU50_03990 [Polyangia bacterium]|nr:hypothetical protein [Polyangia bacterium]
MTRSARVAAACAGGLLLLVTAASVGRAADQKAVVDQIKAHNQAATAAYGGSRWDEMKKEAEAAISLANDNNLAGHAALAQAYVLLGVAEVEAKHRDAGVSAFVKALGVSAAAEVPSKMNKKAVKAAFTKAEDQDATATKQATPEPKKPEKTADKADSKDKEKQAAGDSDKAAKELAAKEAKETKEAKEAKENEKGKEKELAAARAAEKKEHEAKETLEKSKADADKQIAELKARVQQLEKDVADRDHQLATLRDDDKKEHEAKEKLEKERQEADARDKERKSREAKESTEREKLADGPDLPKTIPEPVHCTVPDEAPAGADLFVHCAAQPSVGAKLIVFYYRPAGVVPYNAILMEPTKKGWFVAQIPGRRISGKFVHYYAEARDARQEVAATSGKPSSPNVLTVLPTGSVVASQTPAPASNGGSLKQARASEKVTRKRSKK